MLHIWNEKWLASYVLILQLICYFPGLQASTYRDYEFVDDEIKVDEIQHHCAQRSGAIINDLESLQNAINALKLNPNNDSYWTGLSWHSRRNGYFWYRNATLNTSVAQSLVELPDSWICFVVRRNTIGVIPEPCEELHHFLCEDADGGLSQSIKTFPNRTCNASELQNTCKMLFHNNMTGVKFNDIQDLKKKKANAQLKDDEKYWTALSWHSQHKFCWNQDANLTANVSRNVHWWFCFIVRGETPHLEAERCNKKHKFICELREGEGANTMTSSIVDSTESSKGSNPMGKFENEAIEKISKLNVTNKGSLKDAAVAIQKLFHDLNDTNDGKGSVNVLVATQTLESFAFEYAKTHLKKNESIIVVEGNYEMKIQRLATNILDPLVFPENNTTQQLDQDRVGIALPTGVLKGKDFAIFIIYNDMSQFVPELPALELRNRIIAAKVYPSPQGTLQENVTISFGRNKKEKDKSHCVFWNFTIKSAVNGDWSRKGCSLEKSDDNKIICTCNHLTNFAVLMQVVENEVTSKHFVAMEMITYVGCALSLTAETLTIIAYCTLTDFKQEQVQIRLNLVIALAAAQLAFLSGIDALEPKGLCVFVAALIHFFYLVGFAWMFFEGVYLYLMVVKVFNTEIRLRAFYTVAWGCPAGIVVLSIVLAACQEGGLHSYIHGAFCWVSFSNNLIWTFVAPVLLVCVTNAVLLSLVIREILKMQSGKAYNVAKLRQAAKACVVLSPLLGMTWVFGILSVTNASLVFQYIFTILNSLQGFFIFLLHVLRNADVRAEFKRKKKMWFEMRGRVAELHSSVRWTSEAIRSDVFELKNKYGVSSSHLSSRNKDQSQSFQEPLPFVDCN